MKRSEDYQETISRLYPIKIKDNEDGARYLSRPITFCVTNACQLRCTYCLPAGTQIKMSDFSSKNIEDVLVGDKILGFEEYNQKGKHTKLKEGIVEQLYHRKSNTITLVFENGQKLTITPDHKVLVRRNSSKSNYDYRKAKNLKIGQTVYGLPYCEVESDFSFVEDKDYIVGYVIAMMQGDGCFKYYPENPTNKYVCRLAVKDQEIIDRMKKYLSVLNIKWGSYQFLISKKENIYTEALTFNNKASYNILISLINDNFNKNNHINYYKGYLAGIYDAEGHIDKEKSTISIVNTNTNIISEIEDGLKILDIPYKTSLIQETVNKKELWQVRILGKESNKYVYKFLQFINNAVQRKKFDSFYNQSLLKQLKIKNIIKNKEEVDVYNIGTSCHTYIANNIAVHNCYEKHKGNKYMKFETAKKFIDLLLSGEKGMDQYINPEISPAVMLEFIGGEPFMAIDLMDQITDYWMDRTTELMHPWAEKFRISISSNGVAYFEPKVQEYLKKHVNHLSLSITVDGDKELHNACRVYAGTNIGCYDEAVAAVKDWMASGYNMGSKITIAPENLKYLDTAIIHMLDLGYEEIMANCVYEAEWSNEEALLFYEQGKKIADEFLDRDLDFENTYYCSLYEENFFKPKDESDVQNWCFPAGTMIMTPEGEKRIETLSLGDNVVTKNGIYPVENIFTHNAKNLVELKASDMRDTIVTRNHPYWTKRYKSNISEWVPVGELHGGDQICLKKINGDCVWTTVRSVEELDEEIEVYNMTVSTDHTFVANGAVVHNCGGTGIMIACDWDGEIYPCIRYMEMSLGDDQPKLPIGNVDDGLIQSPEHLKNLQCLQCIDRRTQSTDECFYCPIGEGCSWCFPAGTMILTPDGEKSIEKLSLGDMVITKDGIHPVESLLCRDSDDLVKIKALDMRDTVVTKEHPYWGKDKNSDTPQWIPVEELCEGDQICLKELSGKYKWTEVQSIEKLNEKNKVYNLTVSGDHSFVANGAIVHNCSAWNYQLYGTADKRCTRICPTHKARSMFNVYFWNKYYLKNNMKKYMEMNIPEEWALEIIPVEEYNMLKDLVRKAKEQYES